MPQWGCFWHPKQLVGGGCWYPALCVKVCIGDENRSLCVESMFCFRGVVSRLPGASLQRQGCQPSATAPLLTPSVRGERCSGPQSGWRQSPWPKEYPVITPKGDCLKVILKVIA